MNKALALVSGILLAFGTCFVPFTGAFADSGTSVTNPPIGQDVMGNIFLAESDTTPKLSYDHFTVYDAATGTTQTSPSSWTIPTSAGSYFEYNYTNNPFTDYRLYACFTRFETISTALANSVKVEWLADGIPFTDCYHYSVTDDVSTSSGDVHYTYFVNIITGNSAVEDKTTVSCRFTILENDYTSLGSFSGRTSWYRSQKTSYDNWNIREIINMENDIQQIFILGQILDAVRSVSSGSTFNEISSQLDEIYNLLNYDINEYDSVNDVVYTPRLWSDGTLVNKDGTYLDADTEYIISLRFPGTYTYNLYTVDLPLGYDSYYVSDNGDYTYPQFDILIGGGPYNQYRYTSLYTYYPDAFGMWTSYTIDNGNGGVTRFQIYRLYIYTPNLTYPQYLTIRLKPDKAGAYFINRTAYITKYKDNTLQFHTLLQNWLFDIWQNITGQADSQIVDDVTSMADNIQQSADTVNEFHGSAQTSVNESLQQIDTSLYPIGGTGLTYMKTYTQNMFEYSNGFRIWFMLPLILATIGLLVRWRTPK